MSIGTSLANCRAVKPALLAVCAVLILAAAPADEYLSAPELPGFVVGYEAADERQSMREEVPAGETVEDWTRMVTTQRFAGVAGRISPFQLVASMARMMSATCPGATTSEPASLVRNGHAAAQARADCPMFAETGKPETFIVLAISGTRDLHVKQVAFRRVPTADDIRWGEEFLAGVVLCNGGDNSEACAD